MHATSQPAFPWGQTAQIKRLAASQIPVIVWALCLHSGIGCALHHGDIWEQTYDAHILNFQSIFAEPADIGRIHNKCRLEALKLKWNQPLELSHWLQCQSDHELHYV